MILYDKKFNQIAIKTHSLKKICVFQSFIMSNEENYK